MKYIFLILITFIAVNWPSFPVAIGVLTAGYTLYCVWSVFDVCKKNN